VLEGISISFIALIVSTLGLPGMAVVFWYVDQRRTDRIIGEHKKELAEVLDRYREDVQQIARFYEDNVLLVKGYERLAGDLTSIITLSTRTLEGLVQKINNNHWCPIARERSGKQ
jgi:hypothetical protein